MILSKIIARLKINSFLLFLIPTIAILGSLLIHNILVSSNVQVGGKYSFLTDIPGNEHIMNCSEDNNYCTGKSTDYLNESSTNIDECFIYKVKEIRSINGNENYLQSDIYNLVNSKWSIKKKYINEKIQLKKRVSDQKNKTCIKNHTTKYFFYKYFPPYSFLLNEKQKDLTLGSSFVVNPFLYGEVSISNLVKRYPINIFFKSLLYIGVILMIMYWYSYNKIFKQILNNDKNIFLFFGVGSALCLFIHIYFLGTTSNNEILKDFRRIVIVLFILFEVFAQSLLAYKLYINKNVFLKYCFNLFVLTKVIFVSIVLIFTTTVLIMLSIFNFPNNIEYILEWNYFIILLVFYLLSGLMWKKIN